MIMDSVRSLIDMLLTTISSIVAAYARWSSRSTFVIPEPLDGGAAAGPLLMLVTGSMIVSDFFDQVADRFVREGYRVVVFQPEDLLTVSLEKSAHDIDRAVRSVLATTGEKKLTMLAECNGGVAARYWLTRLGGDKYVDRLVTFVSAHHGTIPAAIAVCSSFKEIQPQCSFVQVMDDAGLPDGTEMISIYMTEDEVMKPCTTSRVEGALNIEICDRGVTARARSQRFSRPSVHQLMGNLMNVYCPVHFAAFYDEGVSDLLVSCMKDDLETVRKFDTFEIKVS
jgi:hypothetical protein